MRRRGAGKRTMRQLARNRRGFVATEFAIVSIPFFAFTLGVLELSYDLYTQVALDLGLSYAVRNLQTGNAQNQTNAAAFLSNYLCPALQYHLVCNGNVYIYVQRFTGAGSTDFYDITTPSLLYPVSGGVINLPGVYASSTSFCNVAPNTFILVSALYLGPSFVGGLLPGVLTATYGGQAYHVTVSSTGFASERFTATPAANGTTVAGTC
jgi:Flp pilus assembly protein TadG